MERFINGKLIIELLKMAEKITLNRQMDITGESELWSGHRKFKEYLANWDFGDCEDIAHSREDHGPTISHGFRKEGVSMGRNLGVEFLYNKKDPDSSELAISLISEGDIQNSIEAFGSGLGGGFERLHLYFSRLELHGGLSFHSHEVTGATKASAQSTYNNLVMLAMKELGYPEGPK